MRELSSINKIQANKANVDVGFLFAGFYLFNFSIIVPRNF